MPDPNRKPLFRAGDLLPALAGLAVGTAAPEFADVPQVALGVANRRVDDRMSQDAVALRQSRQTMLDAQEAQRARELGDWIGTSGGFDPNDPLTGLALRALQAGDYEGGRSIAASAARRPEQTTKPEILKGPDGNMYFYTYGPDGRPTEPQLFFKGPTPAPTATYHRQMVTNADGSQSLKTFEIGPDGRMNPIDEDPLRGPDPTATPKPATATEPSTSAIRLAIARKMAFPSAQTGIDYIDQATPEQLKAFSLYLKRVSDDPELLEAPAAPAAAPQVAPPAGTSPAPAVAAPSPAAGAAPRPGLVRAHSSPGAAPAAAPPGTPAPTATPKPKYTEGQRAKHPQTGQELVYREKEGGWVPVQPQTRGRG